MFLCYELYCFLEKQTNFSSCLSLKDFCLRPTASILLCMLSEWMEKDFYHRDISLHVHTHPTYINARK